MTADLDLSPEALERQARNMELIAQRSGFNAADWERGAATLRALAAENARLRAENATAYQRGWMNGATVMQKIAVSAVKATGNKAGNRWISRQEALERVGGLPLPDVETNND